MPCSIKSGQPSSSEVKYNRVLPSYRAVGQQRSQLSCSAITHEKRIEQCFHHHDHHHHRMRYSPRRSLISTTAICVACVCGAAARDHHRQQLVCRIGSSGRLRGVTSHSDESAVGDLSGSSECCQNCLTIGRQRPRFSSHHSHSISTKAYVGCGLPGLNGAAADGGI